MEPTNKNGTNTTMYRPVFLLFSVLAIFLAYVTLNELVLDVTKQVEYGLNSALLSEVTSIPPTRSPTIIENKFSVEELGKIFQTAQTLADKTITLADLERLRNFDIKSYVVIQVDNRPNKENAMKWYKHKRNMTTWWDEKAGEYWKVSFVYNYLAAKHHGYKYVLFIGPKRCYLPNNIEGARYWCKVPSILLATYIFPNAKGILFLDSDAFLGSIPIDTWLLQNKLKVDSDQNAMIIQKDPGFWLRSLNALHPLPYRFNSAINSGVILMNPKSTQLRTILYKWLYDYPLRTSPLEFYSRSYQVSILCHKNAHLNPGNKSDLIRSFYNLTDENARFYFNKNHRFCCWEEGSSFVYTKKSLTYLVRGLTRKSMVNFFEQKTKSSDFKAKVEKNICAVDKIEWKIKDKGNDYISAWPGDQERLQWVIDDNWDKVMIADSLSGVHLTTKSHNLRNLSACMNYNNGCVAYHANNNGRAKLTAAATLNKNYYDSQWNSSPESILQRITTVYLGENNILPVLQQAFRNFIVNP